MTVPSPYAPPWARFSSYPLQGLIVALDFDGTCVTHAYPDIGESIGAEPVLQRLTEEGASLILWTMRSGPELDLAVTWFDQNGIPLLAINQHPEQQTWTSSPKPQAHLYIDDSALGIPLRPARSAEERAFVDWDGVAALIWPQAPKRTRRSWLRLPGR